MKERPILFSAAMVRAILDGRKTQTRRAVKAPRWSSQNEIDVWTENDPFVPDDNDTSFWIECPYGQPGDRLWVRETWGVGSRPHPIDGCVEGIEYRADEPLCDKYEDMPLHRVDHIDLSNYDKLGWKPSIHMPRWASRITLEIVSVRVERLNDINDADCHAEGVVQRERPDQFSVHSVVGVDDLVYLSPRGAFSGIWTKINGNGSWQKNPWVWVIQFKQVKT